VELVWEPQCAMPVGGGPGDVAHETVPEEVTEAPRPCRGRLEVARHQLAGDAEADDRGDVLGPRPETALVARPEDDGGQRRGAAGGARRRTPPGGEAVEG